MSCYPHLDSLGLFVPERKGTLPRRDLADPLTRSTTPLWLYHCGSDGAPHTVNDLVLYLFMYDPVLVLVETVNLRYKSRNRGREVEMSPFVLDRRRLSTASAALEDRGWCLTLPYLYLRKLDPELPTDPDSGHDPSSLTSSRRHGLRPTQGSRRTMLKLAFVHCRPQIRPDRTDEGTLVAETSTSRIKGQ